jgi:hypothetical protein
MPGSWKDISAMKEFLSYFHSFRLLYLVFAGLFFFLISVTINVIFIPMLDMPEDWCQKWDERNISFQTQDECVEFRTELDELKYDHNQKMEKRLAAKLHGMLIFAVLLTFAIMLISPGKLVEHRITFENYSGAIALAVFYGVIIGFLLPVAFEALLPPPKEWLPDEFYEIRQARIEYVLKQIKGTLTEPKASG